MLTENALLHFEKWLKKQPYFGYNNYTKRIIFKGYCHYNELPEFILTALYIRFFDSLNIHVYTIHEEFIDNQVKSLPVTVNIWSVWINDYVLIGFKSRDIAIGKGIEYANEMYNEKFKP